MVQEKKGLVYGPQNGESWRANSAMKPIPVLIGDVIRDEKMSRFLFIYYITKTLSFPQQIGDSLQQIAQLTTGGNVPKVLCIKVHFSAKPCQGAARDGAEE